MQRRRFVVGAVTGAGLVATGAVRAGALLDGARAVSVATGRAYVPVPTFPSGVLSGDPAPDGVVLWTRIDPVVAGAGVDVTWQIGTTASLAPADVVASGTVATSAATDHTVHVEPTGLQPGTTYWYRFRVGATDSPVGRTRTLPAGSVDSVRFAFFSCQRYVHGYYTAHADLAARALDPATDVDFVVSLGDYVYEGGPADDVTVPGRLNPVPSPSLTLDDFRGQYHLYRIDLDLQAVHAAYPIIGIFDNHDGMSRPGDEQAEGALAAFFEQMPVRRSAGEPNRQYRRFAWGDALELFMLDERQYRDPAPPEADNPLGTSSVDVPQMVEPGRTMLGDAQRTWLKAGLSSSGAAWKVLGSQLVFWPFRSERYPDVQAAAGDGPQRNAGRFLNMTQWDGYQAERRELVDHIHADGVQDVVVIAGDSHFWSAAELPLDWDDPDSPPVLTEFCGSSVTSANADEMGLPDNTLIRPVLAGANPLHLRYIEVTTHGYSLVEMNARRASVSFVSPATILEPQSASRVLARFEVDRGTARMRQVEGTDFLPRPETPTGPTTTVPDGTTPPPAAEPVDATARFTG